MPDAPNQHDEPLASSVVEAIVRHPWMVAAAAAAGLLLGLAVTASVLPGRSIVNGAGGLLAGALTGIGLAWLRADGRRAVTSSDEPGVLVGLTALGSVPTLERDDSTLATVAAMPSEDYQFVTSALFAALGRAEGVLLIGGISRGAGCTTTVANLAVAVARDNRTVAVVDACTDESLAACFGVPSREPGLLDVVGAPGDVIDRVRLTWAMRPVDVGGPSVRFVSFGAGGREIAANLLRSDRTGSVLDELRGRFDVVVIDGGGVTTSTTAVSLSQWVDAFVLVVRRGTEADDVWRARQQLAAARVPVAGYVFTHAAPDERLRCRDQAHCRARELSEPRPAVARTWTGRAAGRRADTAPRATSPQPGTRPHRRSIGWAG